MGIALNANTYEQGDVALRIFAEVVKRVE